MAKVVGIDLGTTNTVVAVLENGRPTIVPNAEGEHLTPSVVAFLEDGKRLVGSSAKSLITAAPEKMISRTPGKTSQPVSWKIEPHKHDSGIVTSVKRLMGLDENIRIGGQNFSPEQISALILLKARLDAERYLGETIEKAVITVPAYFNDAQRQATKKAGQIAGLDVLRIVNEPTAAALAYGLDKEDIHTILVWDLGGGTFDISILKLGEGVFQVVAVNGDTWLGGDDWDEKIVEYFLTECREKYRIELRQDKAIRQRLKAEAEKRKIELSSTPVTSIQLPFPPGEKEFKVTLTRDRFEALTRDLLKRMAGLTKQALADAELKPQEIDRVILVGGATRMPAVHELARKFFTKEPYKDINPDEVVALGAAIQAGILTEELENNLVLIDVTPLSLGIETLGGIFATIIPRNTPIPTSKGHIFTTATDDQTSVEVHVLQGEREMAAYNMSLGRFSLNDIPPLPRGESKIEVTFEIDANGIIQVSGEDLQTDQKQSIKITASSKGISREEIDHLLKDANLHAEEDKVEKSQVEIRVRAENLIRAAEVVLQEIKENVELARRELIGKKIAEVKRALASGTAEEIEKKTSELKNLIEGSLAKVKLSGYV